MTAAAAPAGARPEPELKRGAIGLVSSAVIGMASTAPAYSLAATVGLIAAAATVHTPIVLILAFVPMLCIAVAFHYLNKADVDCGTTFAWVTKALGPHLGWLNGWVIVAADVVVMSNLAQVAGNYSLSLVGVDPAAHEHWATALGVAWIVLLTFIVVLGIEPSAKTQWLLLAAEYAILVAFAAVALWKVYTAAPPGALRPSLDWFNPFGVEGGSTALLSGILLAVFIYWGWDTAVNCNEETRRSNQAPGAAAVISTVLLAFVYVVVAMSAQAYAGPEALAENSDDVLGFLGHDVFGSGWEKLMVLAVLTSAAASTQTTILPTARVTLSMSRAGAAPRWLGVVHPVWRTPWLSSIATGVASALLFVLLTSLTGAHGVLSDSIYAIGLLICFYYTFTGLAAVVYYRKILTTSVRTFVLAGVLPAAGALMMFGVFAKQSYDLNSTEYSTAVWLGFGSAVVLGIGMILVGVVLLAFARAAYPGFFSGPGRRASVGYGATSS